ncbi:hypothetical protein J7L27_06275 [Candidatus Bathyarchaeota archaeon]|nr:hypothetical protein [Candidatus Bathyarchaeota archaeon]
MFSNLRKPKDVFGCDKFVTAEEEDPEIALIEFNRYRKKTPRIIKNEYDFLKKKLAPKARERQLSQLKPFQKKAEEKKKDSSDTESIMAERNSFGKFAKTEEKIHVRDEAAEKIGVSSRQLHKINYIYEHEFIPAVKPIVEKLDRGEISVFSNLGKRFLSIVSNLAPLFWEFAFHFRRRQI